VQFDFDHLLLLEYRVSYSCKIYFWTDRNHCGVLKSYREDFSPSIAGQICETEGLFSEECPLAHFSISFLSMFDTIYH